MPLFMIRNDITKVEADVIVNPANEELLEGNGTSTAIFQNSGRTELTKACKEIGFCTLGQAVMTDAFGLPAKYICHAVGPAWNDGKHNEDKILEQTYQSALAKSVEYQCESIAFPLLSSGSYGFPKEVAMQTAIHAISDFLMEQDMVVYLVLYDTYAVSLSKKLSGAVKEYIDDHYVEEHQQLFCASESRQFLARNQRDEILQTRRAGFFEKIRKVTKKSSDLDLTEDWSEDSVSDMELECAPMPSPSMSARSLENLMEHLDETFSQMLLRLIDERGLKDSYVYKKANVDRRHFSKIRKDVNYTPTKKTVLAFAIALELSLDETIDLLNRAGYALSKSSKFDVIISFFLENKSYDIFEINEVLFAYEQPILGE